MHARQKRGRDERRFAVQAIENFNAVARPAAARRDFVRDRLRLTDNGRLRQRELHRQVRDQSGRHRPARGRRAKHVNRQLAAAQSKLYESLWESVQAAQMNLNAGGEDLSGPRGAALVRRGYLSEVDGNAFDVTHGEMPARMAGAFAGCRSGRVRGLRMGLSQVAEVLPSMKREPGTSFATPRVKSATPQLIVGFLKIL